MLLTSYSAADSLISQKTAVVLLGLCKGKIYNYLLLLHHSFFFLQSALYHDQKLAESSIIYLLPPEVLSFSFPCLNYFQAPVARLCQIIHTVNSSLPTSSPFLYFSFLKTIQSVLVNELQQTSIIKFSNSNVCHHIVFMINNLPLPSQLPRKLIFVHLFHTSSHFFKKIYSQEILK